MSKTVMTLPVYVYRADALGDCTNGGISSCVDTLYLIVPDGNRPKLPQKRE